MYCYSDPERENMPHALPNLEVFQTDENGCLNGEPFVLPHEPGERAYGVRLGWFYAFGFPGCLWDSDPVGPFDTEEEALKDARDDDL